MAGIVSYGAYVPLHRLARSEISKAWGGSGGEGEKAVASYDEDSITMAVAAARDCSRGFDRNNLDGVYFASTTSPYWEKLASATIAAAMGLRSDILTADFSGSLRSGTNALKAALDAVTAGSASCILVVASDARIGIPRSDKEMSFGDAAAAVIVARESAVVNVEGRHSVSGELFDFWRSDRDVFVRSAEDRFAREVGYNAVVTETVRSALDKFKLKPADIAKACFYAPDVRQLMATAAASGFDTKGGQVEESLHNSVGNCGASQALLMLVCALEKARQGDRLLLVSHGDGCDVLSLVVQKEFPKVKGRRGVKMHLETKRKLPSYQKYVLWRELVQVQPASRPPMIPVSPVALLRDRSWGLSLHGSKCKKCGMPQYPVQRVCVICGAQDQYVPYSFADLVGRLTTFSHDNLGAAIDPPSTVCAVDFEGGGRVMCDMTDRDPAQVVTGMPVEMVFRKLHYSGGIHNYWWKCSPIRC